MVVCLNCVDYTPHRLHPYYEQCHAYDCQDISHGSWRYAGWHGNHATGNSHGVWRSIFSDTCSSLAVICLSSGRVLLGAGTATADLIVAVYKYNINTTLYTLIGLVVDPGQSLNAGANFTWPGTSLPSVSFLTGDRLYFENWANITVSDATGTTIRWAQSSNATLGVANDQVVTPGFSSSLLAAPPMHAAEIVAGALTSKGTVASTLAASEVAANSLNAARS